MKQILYVIRIILWFLFLLTLIVWIFNLKNISEIFIVMFLLFASFWFFPNKFLEKVKINKKNIKQLKSKRLVIIILLFCFLWYGLTLWKTEKLDKTKLENNIKIVKEDTTQTKKEIIKNWEEIKEKKFEQKEEKEVTKENLDEKYKVKEIIDWDTVILEKSWKDLKIRMIWIDSPESTTTKLWHIEPFWIEAKNKLNELIFDKEVSLEYDESQWKIDRYWRDLIYVFVNWKNINEEMIRLWYAKEYTFKKAYKYQKQFKKAEQEAKSRKIWIWSIENNNNNNNNQEKIKNTWDTKVEWKIKWNINSKWKKIYHLPWCKSYKKTRINLEKWERYFDTVQEAENAWFILANNC